MAAPAPPTPLFTKLEAEYIDNELLAFAMLKTTGQIYKLARFEGKNFIAQHYAWSTSDNTLETGAKLPAGEYWLVLVGINWGGPSNFKVSLTLDGAAQPMTELDATSATVKNERPKGVTWKPAPQLVRVG